MRPGSKILSSGFCCGEVSRRSLVRRIVRKLLRNGLTTAANLVNELVEAQQQNGVRRVLAKWMRYDVIALDEVGYVPLAEIGAEFLFQVIAERAERASLIVTTKMAGC
jgi:DNA replication protein DnaC